MGGGRHSTRSGYGQQTESLSMHLVCNDVLYYDFRKCLGAELCSESLSRTFGESAPSLTTQLKTALVNLEGDKICWKISLTLVIPTLS